MSQLENCIDDCEMTEDVILCHSDLLTLGEISRIEKFTESLIDMSVNGKTIVVPTFTYSAFRQEIFDPLKSRSRIGSLGNMLLNKGTRTEDPNFSHLLVGDFTPSFHWNSGKPSFGPDSFYETLQIKECGILLVGVDFRALSMMMHYEIVLHVPYRYPKEFQGSIRAHNGVREVVSIHYVRCESCKPVTDRTKLFKIALETGVAKYMKFGDKNVFYVSERPLFELVEREFSKNPLIFLNVQTPFENREAKCGHPQSY